MPRKPKENYHQLNGRPHAGLEDPAKFGLTFNEVVDLINKGEWRAFYQKWLYNERKKKRIEELHFLCPICNQLKTDYNDWKHHGKCCKKCSLPDETCANCRKKRKIAFKAGSFQLCNQCRHLLEALKELTK